MTIVYYVDSGGNEAEAENLKIRAALIRAIEKYIENNNLTQAAAAKLMGVYQPRVSDLLQGKIDKFTILEETYYPRKSSKRTEPDKCVEDKNLKKLLDSMQLAGVVALNFF